MAPSHPLPIQRDDLKAARKAGCNPSGAIMIHGAKNGFEWLGRLHRFKDWTIRLCAVTNDEIDEIWNAVSNGAIGRDPALILRRREVWHLLGQAPLGNWSPGTD